MSTTKNKEPETLVDEDFEFPEIKNSEIDNMLSDYEDVEIPKVDNDDSIGSSEHWRGNPAYYQTGKKQGQLRPSASKKKNVVTEPSTLGGEVLSGAILIAIVDIIVPEAICAINNLFSKQKIKSSDLKMTKKQRNELEPLMDAVIKQYEITGHPLLMLGISMVSIYAGNFVTLKYNLNTE